MPRHGLCCGRTLTLVFAKGAKRCLVASLLAKTVILREAEYPVRRGFLILSLTLWNTGSPAFAGDDGLESGAFTLNELPPIQFSNSRIDGRHSFAFPRRDAPELCMSLSPNRGRGECRVPAAPAASCAKGGNAHECRHHRSTGTPGIPARNGFNGLFRALPGDEFVLSPSSAE